MEGAEFRNICIPGAGRKDLPPGSGEPGERWALAVELIEASPTGIMVTDLDAAIVAVNPAFSRITGFGRRGRGEDTASARIGTAPARLLSRCGGLSSRPAGGRRDLNRRKNDQVYPNRLSIFALRDNRAVRYA
jgi:PAS domain-containing protein